MAKDPILIRNDTGMMVKYGVWWGGLRKAFGPLPPGQFRSYEDDDPDSRFNVAFYYQNAGVKDDINDHLIGQSMETPLAFTVALTAFNGGFGIIRIKTPVPASLSDAELKRRAAAGSHYE